MANNKYIAVATIEELELPAAVNSCRIPIVMGVGGVNVIKTLRELPKDADILNIGFCGSSHFKIGEEVSIGKVRLYHPNCEYKEPTFRLGKGALCLTAGDFVLGGVLPPNSVVDMELAYIAALGFKNLRAVKYVSDKLNYETYEKVVSTLK